MSKEEKALGAFLSAMHECKLDGGKMREAMLKVLGLAADALGGEAVVRLTVPESRTGLVTGTTEYAHTLPPGEYLCYTHPAPSPAPDTAKPEQEPVKAKYGLTKSIIHGCPAIVLPQSFLQRLGMTAQILPLKGFSDEQAIAFLADLNSAVSAMPEAAKPE